MGSRRSLGDYKSLRPIIRTLLPLVALLLGTTTVTVRGAGPQAAPAWTVNPADFEFSATITAQVELDGVISGSEDNLLAAFVGEELRGVVAPIEVLDTWMYFLTVYANTSGETVEFSTYEAVRDTVVDLEDAVFFEIGAVVGDPQDPVVLRGELGAVEPPTEIGVDLGRKPDVQALYPNFPNPFNGATRIDYELDAAQKVRLAIYNLAGQRVRMLVAAELPAGGGSASWDGRDDRGRIMPSGVYVYALRGRDSTKARKLVLLR